MPKTARGFYIVFFCILLSLSQVHTQHNFQNSTFPILPKSVKSARFNTSGTVRLYFNEIFGIFGGGGGGGGGSGSSDEEEGFFRNCSCECGVTNQENRIVGGRPTGVNRYPWIARIVYDGLFHCGGSLISEDYVLTAAHCVRRLKRSKIRVILGDHDQTTTAEAPAKLRMVSAVIKNRNFDADSYNHDIALLKLRKPVVYSKNIKPICVPRVADDPAGKIGTVIGWGRTMEGGMLPSIVQEVEVPILTLQQCRAMKYRASRITTYMLCAGKGAMDSCQGDSGGPLVVQAGGKYEIVGIVSWGVGCARPGYPGVYTRVGRYINWIRSNVQDSCLCN